MVINRDNVEIRTTVEDRRQGDHLANDRSACLHEDDSPTARGAVDASDVSYFFDSFFFRFTTSPERRMIN